MFFSISAKCIIPHLTTAFEHYSSRITARSIRFFSAHRVANISNGLVCFVLDLSTLANFKPHCDS